MKHFQAWLLHLIQYTLRKKLFWILPLALIAISIAAAAAARSHQLIRIPLYCAQPDALTRAAMEELIHSDDGLYRFYESPSQDYLREDVSSRKAECGYVFPDRLEERLQLGEPELITVYTSSSTVLSSIVNEAVYNAVFHSYAKTMLTGYILSGDVIPEDADAVRQAVEEQYAYEEANTPSFHVVYEDVSEEFYDNQSAFRIPLRGFLALLIFLSSLAGVSQFRHDRQKGYFLLRHPMEKRYVPAIYALLPALFLSLLGFFCLLLAGSALSGAGMLAELVLLPAYAAVCALLALLLNHLVRSSIAYDALIPILMIFCLLYSPVFFDLSSYLPAGQLLKWLTLKTLEIKQIR